MAETSFQRDAEGRVSNTGLALVQVDAARFIRRMQMSLHTSGGIFGGDKISEFYINMSIIAIVGAVVPMKQHTHSDSLNKHVHSEITSTDETACI